MKFKKALDDATVAFVLMAINMFVAMFAFEWGAWGVIFAWVFWLGMVIFVSKKD